MHGEDGIFHFMSWNCRGMGNPWTIRMLLDFEPGFKPEVVFLMETKVRRRKMEIVQQRLRYDGLFFVEGINNGGGLVPGMERKKSSAVTEIFQKSH